MEALVNHKTYTPGTADKIEAMGAMAVSIANRWMMGWPDRTRALLQADNLLACLEEQVELEKSILANEANLRHLTPREILQLHKIRESPPYPA